VNALHTRKGEVAEGYKGKKKTLRLWLNTNTGTCDQITSVDAGEAISAQVLSEAMITTGECSVTTETRLDPAKVDDVTVSHDVAEGRNTELNKHITELGLKKRCQTTEIACALSDDGDRQYPVI
jgi:hypothetical protein